MWLKSLKMKKIKSKNINLNFTNRFTYIFISFIIILLIGVSVLAFGTSNPPTFGHSAGELDLSGGVQGNAVFLGSIKIGTSVTCDVNAEGSLRYNSIDKKIEYCNGTDWKAVGSSCGDTVTYEGGPNAGAYSTVQIGTQCWLGENLNVGTMLASVLTLPTNNEIVEKWCNGADSGPHSISDEAACDGTGGNPNYGGLYTWDEAVGCPAAGCDVAGDAAAQGAQGICPSGWHIPTDAEQNTLDQYLATGSCNAFRNGQWECAPAGSVLQQGGSSGFEDLLAGMRYDSGSFAKRGLRGHYWSSTVSGSLVWRRALNIGDASVLRDKPIQGNGHSVRCLKN